MATIVVGGDNSDFNAVLYGAQKHPGTVEFLRNQVYGVASQFGDMMSQAASTFLAKTQYAFESVNGLDALRRAKAAIGLSSSVFQEDLIRPLMSIQEIQHAPLVMERFIMAQPDLRALFNRQLCDGFADTYIDMHPGTVGENHYDYRLVMDGQVVLTEDEDGEPDWYAVNYLDEYQGTDTGLDHSDQVAIRTTWSLIKQAIKARKEDPSSREGGML